MLPPSFDPSEEVATESATKAKKPPLFKVLLHNDDYTTMEFVVYVLEAIFNMDEEAAVAVMLNVHQRGIGVAGIYTYEIAQEKVEQVSQLAKAHEYPLLCTMEEE